MLGVMDDPMCHSGSGPVQHIRDVRPTRRYNSQHFNLKITPNILL